MALWATACIAAMVLIPSCESCNKKAGETEKAPDVAIRADFSEDPPLAREVFIQMDGESKNSVLVLATFDEEDRKRFEKNMLAINLENQRIVLRDDGAGGDEKADDKLFTARVSTDVDVFQKELEEQSRRQGNSNSMTIFINRSPVKIPVKPIDIKDIRNGKPLKIFPKPQNFAPAELKDHSLMITHIDVIEDPKRTITDPCTGTGAVDGVWTFGFLMRQMASPNPGAIANDADVSTFVMNWLNKWMSDQLINSDNVPSRIAMQTAIITPWLNRSASGGAPAGQLDMKFAPFRLLAIVNRLDLRGNTGYSVTNGGEGRFVFGVLDENCNPMAFTVIFEYGINKTDCESLKAFAKQWYDLKDLTPGASDYNDALQAITDQFTLCGTNPAKPNQSSLNQLRTNERAIDSPWQLREFNIGASGQIDEITTTREPADHFNAKVVNAEVQVLADFANMNAAAILDNTFDIPLTSGGMPFLGGKADTDGGEFWDGTTTAGPTFITNDSVRHALSLNTCSGCHAGESNTSFTHITPAAMGSSPTLSGFLVGDGGTGPFIVSDPANRPSGGSPIQWEFNDLQRRADDLEAFVNSSCKSVFFLVELLTFKPVNFSH
jgi:hypothetical protein